STHRFPDSCLRAAFERAPLEVERRPPLSMPLRVCGLLGLGDLREVRLQDQIAQPVLRVRVLNSADEREVPPLAVDRERPRRERDDPPASVAPLPDGEANELEAIELAASVVDLGVGELAGWRGSIGA